jgi:hypothetical protein
MQDVLFYFLFAMWYGLGLLGFVVFATKGHGNVLAGLYGALLGPIYLLMAILARERR